MELSLQQLRENRRRSGPVVKNWTRDDIIAMDDDTVKRELIQFFNSSSSSVFDVETLLFLIDHAIARNNDELTDGVLHAMCTTISLMLDVIVLAATNNNVTVVKYLLQKYGDDIEKCFYEHLFFVAVRGECVDVVKHLACVCRVRPSNSLFDFIAQKYIFLWPTPPISDVQKRIITLALSTLYHQSSSSSLPSCVVYSYNLKTYMFSFQAWVSTIEDDAKQLASSSSSQQRQQQKRKRQSPQSRASAMRRNGSVNTNVNKQQSLSSSLSANKRSCRKWSSSSSSSSSSFDCPDYSDVSTDDNEESKHQQ